MDKDFFLLQLNKIISGGDKDVRCMAASDLSVTLAQLQDFFPIDFENRFIDCIKILLKDQNYEINSLAVKIVNSTSHWIRGPIVRTIFQVFLEGTKHSEQGCREASYNGIKGLVENLNYKENTEATEFLSTLIQTLLHSEDSSYIFETLDIFQTFCIQAGPLIPFRSSQFNNLFLDLLALLKNVRSAIRKRAAKSLQIYFEKVSSCYFNEVVKEVVKGYNEAKDVEFKKSYVSFMSSLSQQKSVNWLILASTVLDCLLDGLKVDDEELKESCLMGYEHFLCSCPLVINYKLDEFIMITYNCLSFNTYYENHMETDEEGNEDESDWDGSDNDDISWKVRCQACRIFQAILAQGFHNKASFLYEKVLPKTLELINDKVDEVASAATDLLVYLIKVSRMEEAIEQSVSIEVSSLKKLKQVVDGVRNVILHNSHIINSKANNLVLKKDIIQRTRGLFILTSMIDNFGMELNNTYEEEFLKAVDLFRQEIIEKKGKNLISSTFQSQILIFLNTCISHFPSTQKLEASERLLVGIPNIFVHGNSELINKAQILSNHILHLCKSISPAFFKSEIVNFYYGSILKLLASKNGSDCAVILNSLGLWLTSGVDYLDPLLIDETIVIFYSCCEMPSNIMNIFDAMIYITKDTHTCQILSRSKEFLKFVTFSFQYLQQNDQNISISVLIFLLNILERSEIFRNTLPVESVLNAIFSIQEKDNIVLFVNFLKFITLSLKMNPTSTLKYLNDDNIKLISKFIQKHGADVQFQNVFRELIKEISNMHVSFSESKQHIMKQLISILRQLYLQDIGQNKFSNCPFIAIICVNNSILLKDTLQECLRSFEQSPSHSQVIQNLEILGEIAKEKVITDIQNIICQVKTLLNNENSEIFKITCVCLGNIAIGYPTETMPILIEDINNENFALTMLLSLKQFIIGAEPSILLSHVDKLLGIFHEFKLFSEENYELIGECVGLMCSRSKASSKDFLETFVNNMDPLPQKIGLTAIKLLMSSGELMEGDYFLTIISQKLNYEDLSICRISLECLHVALHKHPTILRQRLSPIFEKLTLLNMVKPDLVDIVEMGPFKHRVDKGLGIRKIAVQCLTLIAKHYIGKLDMNLLINNVVMSLSDDEDIQNLILILLLNIAQAHPTMIQEYLDKLADSFEVIIRKETKKNSNKQELEKHGSVVRGVIRVVVQFSSMADHSICPRFCALVKNLQEENHLVFKEYCWTTASG